MKFHLAAAVAWQIAPLFVAAAAADDPSDCAGGDLAAGIPACTRIIERTGEPPTTLADAYVNRAKFYLVRRDNCRHRLYC